MSPGDAGRNGRARGTGEGFKGGGTGPGPFSSHGKWTRRRRRPLLPSSLLLPIADVKNNAQARSGERGNKQEYKSDGKRVIQDGNGGVSVGEVRQGEDVFAFGLSGRVVRVEQQRRGLGAEGRAVVGPGEAVGRRLDEEEGDQDGDAGDGDLLNAVSSPRHCVPTAY